MGMPGRGFSGLSGVFGAKSTITPDGYGRITPTMALKFLSLYSGYLEVLDAQRTANDAELALVRNRQALLAYSVDLMKALGGGWNAGGR